MVCSLALLAYDSRAITVMEIIIDTATVRLSMAMCFSQKLNRILISKSGRDH